VGSSERDAVEPAHPNLRLGPGEIAHAQGLIDELSRVHSLQHCALFVWDPAVGRLRLAAQHWGAGEDLGEVRAGSWTIGLNGVCGRAFTSAAPVLVPDVENDPSFLSFPGSRTRSELAAPIFLDRRPIAVVNLESPRRGAYGPTDVEMLSAWADSISEALRGFYSMPG
jgi:GAF domain-containing protein